MEFQEALPEIITFFSNPSNESSSESLSQQLFKEILKNLLNEKMAMGEHAHAPTNYNHLLQKIIKTELPLICLSPPRNLSKNISFYGLFKYRSNSFKFFFDIITYWIIPGHRLNVTMFYASDFQIPSFGKELYTLCEITVRLENQEEWQAIQSNFPLMVTELQLGIDSAYYASKILEIKGLTTDKKTGLIHQYILKLLKRFHKHTIKIFLLKCNTF